MTNSKFENDAETVKSCRLCMVGLPFREAVEPPLFDPVFRDRLLSDKNSDFFTHLENLKKLRKHPPRLVTIVEVDFILGSHFHTIKSNLGCR